MTTRNKLIIRASLTGNRCRGEGFDVQSAAPVLGLCRKLIAEGFNSGAMLEVYRADVLAIRVRTLAHGARLAISEGKDGLRFCAWKAPPFGAVAPPIAPREVAAVIGAAP